MTTTTTCTRCGDHFECEATLLGEPRSSVCLPCLLVAKRFGKSAFTSTPTRQAKLLSGLDCLPGQQDLFDGLDGAK